MSIIPQRSKVTLYKLNKIVDGRPIPFKSRAAQTAYMNKHKVLDSKMQGKDFSYLRVNRGSIKIGIPISDAYKCNYMSFTNPDFENKVFYAFLSEPEYVNNNCTRFNYSIDDWQTWALDAVFEWGNIDRETESEADITKSNANPFDITIQKYLTPEPFAVTKELEDFYTTSDDYKNFPSIFDNKVSVCIYLSDFDKDAFKNSPAYAAFLDCFDNILGSNGIWEKGGGGISPNIPIMRGYGIYEMSMRQGASGDERLTTAFSFLTQQGLTGQNLGNYQMPNEMFNAYVWYKDPKYIDFTTYDVIPRDYSVKCKKLLRYPYQYLRVLNNEGDIKEYKYEDFIDIARGTGNGKIKFVPLLDGVPSTMIVPVNYKINAWNIDERMEIHTFPQIGFCTDAYQAFLGSQSIQNIGSRTVTLNEAAKSGFADFVNNPGLSNSEKKFLNMAASGLPAILDMVTGIKSGASKGAATGSVGAAVGMGIAEGGKGLLGQIGNMSTENPYAEASDLRKYGVLEDGYYFPAKNAYVADQYHPGSTNGTIGYYMPNTRPTGVFTIFRVKLKEAVLKVWDDVLVNTGCTYGAMAIPLICNYIRGATDPEKIPHFYDYNGDKITYVKTTGMKVSGLTSDVERRLEAIFDGGVQFVLPEE